MAASKEDLEKLKKLLEKMEDKNDFEAAQKELRALYDRSMAVRVAMKELVKTGSTEFESQQHMQRLVLGYGKDEMGLTRLGPGTGVVLQGALGRNASTSLNATRLEDNEETVDEKLQKDVKTFMQKNDLEKSFLEAKRVAEQLEPKPPRPMPR